MTKKKAQEASPKPTKASKARATAKSKGTSQPRDKHVQPQDVTVTATIEDGQIRNVKTVVELSKFEQVASGKCPHCGQAIKKHETNKGVGERHYCSNKKCAHVWYLNRVIHTCKCLTCDRANLESS
jgi:predicted RNA-binding Zn-ribbon protein involved in translation (DUF1610 family)